MADGKAEKERARSTAGEGSKERTVGAGQRELTLHLPSLEDMRRSATPERVLWFGGLGALAALGVIEWPVAAVVGVGTYVAKQMAKSEVSSEERRRSETGGEQRKSET